MLINLTINGQAIQAREGQSVLDAARENGITIPTLCHHKDLSPVGACRLCIVQVEKMRGLVAACTLPVNDGMVVRTETPNVIEERKFVLEMLLSDHPNECMICEQDGACELQDWVYYYQVPWRNHKGARHHYPIGGDPNPFIFTDFNKCILCTRCVRACAEIQGRNVWGVAYRGFNDRIVAGADVLMLEAGCESCGACAAYCPTGALTDKPSRGKGRAYQFEKVMTTCPYCGVGCQFDLNVKDGKVGKVTSNPDAGVNGMALCVKGRYGYEFIHHPDRLTKPLVKSDGQFVETTWDKALNLVAQKFADVRRRHGSDAFAVLASAKATNEENYLIQKFARAVMGTNNVDHCARLCHASTVTGLATAFGSGAMTNSIVDLEQAKAILVIGSNTSEQHPVIGTRIRRAVRHGAKLIVADPRAIDLANMATIYLRQRPGTDIALLNGLAHIILHSEWGDDPFIAARTEGFEEWRTVIKQYTPARVSEITGVSVEDLCAAARLYGENKPAAIYYAMGITQHTVGHNNVLAVANLAMLTGNIGKPGAGVNPLRGQNNVQGACDVGALPDFYTGYQKVIADTSREKFEKAWAVKLPPRPGLTVTEMFDAAHDGQVKAMWIIGENVALSDPDSTHVREALEHLDFLVVSELFMTETAQLADVALPAASFAEKDGTFTNTERRVQRVRKAIEPPGHARADWEIVCDLAQRMSATPDWNYNAPSQIMDEIASLTPQYAGIAYERLETSGLQWPVPSQEHPGTPILHTEKFTRGKGLFSPVEHQEPAETPDAEFPFTLTTGRILQHYHTGSMTHRVPGLETLAPEEHVEVNPNDAARMGLNDSDWVRVTSRRGTVKARVWLTERVGPGLVFMTFHYAEALGNVLTNPAVDPIAKIPEFKVCAVRVERVNT